MNSSTMPLAAHYEKLVESGHIKGDPAQRSVIAAMEKMESDIAKRGLFHKTSSTGLYIWGSVGRGKSMLMDLFFEYSTIEKKRRAHFHAFMQDIHSRLHLIRLDGQRGKYGGDPVALVSQQLAEEAKLLCFDELQATDVADATLLYRLFEGLFQAGVIIVSTSNRPPASLYTGEVQRERFDRFVALIESHMNVIPLVSPVDYRYSQMQSLERRYVYPLGAVSDAFIASILHKLCSNPIPKQEKLTIKGRTLTFNLYDQAIGRFTFHDLCETALGPADYLAIAKRCDTVILTGIPHIPREERNEAKRFVTLIDALYESRVKLLATASVPPENIYDQGDGSFEFQRTISRLIEMQSDQWGEFLDKQ